MANTKHRGAEKGETKSTEERVVVLLPPLRPNRRLFFAAIGLLAVWLGYLTFLYIRSRA